VAQDLLDWDRDDSDHGSVSSDAGVQREPDRYDEGEAESTDAEQ